MVQKSLKFFYLYRASDIITLLVLLPRMMIQIYCCNSKSIWYEAKTMVFGKYFFTFILRFGMNMETSPSSTWFYLLFALLDHLIPDKINICNWNVFTISYPTYLRKCLFFLFFLINDRDYFEGVICTLKWSSNWSLEKLPKEYLLMTKD